MIRFFHSKAAQEIVNEASRKAIETFTQSSNEAMKKIGVNMVISGFKKVSNPTLGDIPAHNHHEIIGKSFPSEKVSENYRTLSRVKPGSW